MRVLLTCVLLLLAGCGGGEPRFASYNYYFSGAVPVDFSGPDEDNPEVRALATTFLSDRDLYLGLSATYNATPGGGDASEHIHLDAGTSTTSVQPGKQYDRTISGYVFEYSTWHGNLSVAGDVATANQIPTDSDAFTSYASNIEAACTLSVSEIESAVQELRSLSTGGMLQSLATAQWVITGEREGTAFEIHCSQSLDGVATYYDGSAIPGNG
jgi:hypothetical protein